MDEPRFRVQWSEAAVRDLEELGRYVATDSPSNAGRILDALEERARSLETAPGRGRVVPELADFGITNWRGLVSKPYRVICRIEAETVSVLAVLDGRRDLADLLFERLIRE